MQLTLRKANAVQNSINDAIHSLDLDVMIQVNEFENHQTQIAETHDLFIANLATRTALLDAMYEIRKAVQKANALANIGDMLADVARAEKEIQFNSELSNNKAQLSDEVITGKIERLKATEDRYMRDSISTTVLSKDELTHFRSNAAQGKRAKQKIQDTLLELNVKTQIEISDASVEVLTASGIL